MQSTATDVVTYIAQAPAARQECLTELRKLCLERLEGYEECMEFGMPGYKKAGVIDVSFASQKNYISLYILKEEVVNANRELLAGLSVGKGCIRYTRPEKMNFEVIDTLLKSTLESSSQSC